MDTANIMLHEISIEEQYQLSGGDWFDAVLSSGISLAFVAGVVGMPALLAFAAAAGMTYIVWSYFAESGN
jgi:hypothetical protein